MRLRSSKQHEPAPLRRRVGGIALGLIALAAPSVAAAQDLPGPPAGGPFEVVLEEVVRGDLVLAGNSNLLTAGGWVPPAAAAADVDGDDTTLCAARLEQRGVACADNSSSALVDVPQGARVIAARLYVLTSVSSSVGPLGARLAGPGDDGTYVELDEATPGAPKVGEVALTGRPAAGLRQATWDVTDLVADRGGGDYVVADIVNERIGPWLPVATWAMVVAYELDPATDVADLPAEVLPRFDRRALSWHDGFAVASVGAPVEVEVGGFAIPADRAVFAKALHVTVRTGRAAFENLLFDGGPLGNNATPGSAPPPAGVTIGADPACNSIVDVVNDSICVLGTAVATKAPGPQEHRSAADGVAATSGSGVDLDVVRIPDRALRTGATGATLSIGALGAGGAVPAVLAVSVDQPVGGGS